MDVAPKLEKRALRAALASAACSDSCSISNAIFTLGSELGSSHCACRMSFIVCLLEALKF